MHSYADNNSRKKKKEYPSLFSSIAHEFQLETPNIEKIQLLNISKTKTCFLLTNVLSKRECDILINASEKQGFEKAENYCWMYNDRFNDRFMSDDEELAKFLWKRIDPFIPQDIHGWTKNSLNYRWRYCKYGPGQYFGMHADGAFRPTPSLSSALTFMLYLNSAGESFTGGSTNFYTYKDRKLKQEVVPAAGTAIVFIQEDNDMIHDGGKLQSGTKYILRSDIMFVMGDDNSSNHLNHIPTDFSTDNYIDDV